MLPLIILTCVIAVLLAKYFGLFDGDKSKSTRTFRPESCPAEMSGTPTLTDGSNVPEFQKVESQPEKKEEEQPVVYDQTQALSPAPSNESQPEEPMKPIDTATPDVVAEPPKLPVPDLTQQMSTTPEDVPKGDLPQQQEEKGKNEVVSQYVTRFEPVGGAVEEENDKKVKKEPEIKKETEPKKDKKSAKSKGSKKGKSKKAKSKKTKSNKSKKSKKSKSKTKVTEVKKTKSKSKLGKQK